MCAENLKGASLQNGRFAEDLQVEDGFDLPDLYPPTTGHTYE